MTKRDEPLGSRLLDFFATGVPFLIAGLLLLMSPTLRLGGEVRWELWGKLDGLLLAFTVYYHSIAFVLIAALAAPCSPRCTGKSSACIPSAGRSWSSVPSSISRCRACCSRPISPTSGLPIALAFMLIACIDLDLRQRRIRHAAAALFVALLALRLGEVQISWNVLARDMAAFRQSVMSIDRGSRVLVVHADRASFEAGTVSVFGLLHAASLATIERSALVSGNFAVPGKHVLQVREPFRRFVNTDDRVPPSVDWLRLAAGPLDETDRFYWSQWHVHFDYVYVLFTQARRAQPGPRAADARVGRTGLPALPRDQAGLSVQVAARSARSRAMAARSSGMPAPVRAEVASTCGNAAGCFASAAAIVSIRAASSTGFTWSALVSTIW